MKCLTVSIAVAALIAAAPLAAIANEEEKPQEQAEAAAHAEHSDESQHEHGREHENEVAVFLGGTDEHGHDTEFTWGLDYKRRITERWAVGGLFDYAGGDLRNSFVAASVSFWPGLGNLQLLAAPGVEFHQGRGEGSSEKSEEGEPDKDATYFLFRLGVGYDIHLGERFGLSPQVNLDFVNNEEVWVWGLAVTYGF